ncbi:TATA-binding protein-associated factor mot1 [Gonapodya sp. JEL0774]|nr:TATA-binding protein-associated factor mot1 [Gonapodya sp. JEL0774]
MALGAAVRWCGPELARTALERGLLVLMRGQQGHADGWEARYGGAVGVRWWMAVRGEAGVAEVLGSPPDGAHGEVELSPLLAALVGGLADSDDDVRAVCATALIPVAELLPKIVPPRIVFDRVVKAAWDALGVLDDLTASTAGVCELLGRLVGVPALRVFLGKEGSGVDMGVLVRRLLPFFRHSAPGVRAAVVRCFTVLVDVALESSQPMAGAGPCGQDVEMQDGTTGTGTGPDTPASTAPLPADWLHPDVIRTLFQNFVLEDRQPVLTATSAAASAVAKLFARDKAAARKAMPLPTLGAVFALIATPVGRPIDPASLFVPASNTEGGPVPATVGKQHHGKGKHGGKRGAAGPLPSSTGPGSGLAVYEQSSAVALHDRAMAASDLSVVAEEDVWAGRIAGARALGEVMAVTVADGERQGGGVYVEGLLGRYLQAGWAGQRYIVSMAIQAWAEWVTRENAERAGATTAPAESVTELSKLWDSLVSALTEADGGTTKTLYLESMPWSARVRGEAQIMLNMLTEARVPAAKIPPLPPLPVAGASGGGRVFSPDVALALCADDEFANLIELIPNPLNRDKFVPALDSARKAVEAAHAWYQRQFTETTVRVLAGAAGAVVQLGKAPPKINPVVRNLVNSVSRERNSQIQGYSAKSLGRLVVMLIEKGGTGTNAADKIVRNVGGFIAGDSVKDGLEVRDDMVLGPDILTVAKWDQDLVESEEGKGGPLAISRKSSMALGGASQDGGQPSLKRRKTSVGPGSKLELADVDLRSAIEGEDDYQKSLRTIAKRGAEAFFGQLCKDFSVSLFDKLPRVLDLTYSGIKEYSDPLTDLARADLITHSAIQEAVNSLFTLSTLAPALFATGGTVRNRTLELVPSVTHALRSPHPLLRNVAARCMASVAAAAPIEVFPILIEKVLPLIDDVTNLHHRQAGAEAVYHVVQAVNLRSLLPYLIFLVVPVLRHISDQNNPMRLICSRTFAELVRIMPLEPGAPDPEGLSEHLVAQKREERKFIGQLIGQEKVEEFDLPAGTVTAELRQYQKEGVNWLAFLSRYGLHGILCDDMGLGKTLQSITIVAADHQARRERYAQTRSPADAHLPSLVVCPPTIVAHWFHEIGTFAPHMNPIMYQGPAHERTRLRPRLREHDVVITSYDTLRIDVDFLSANGWNFCILDEGHVIKNPATKLTRATKSIIAQHRLVLSGTPVQNKVLELWSLFDFLMPGFLGSQKQFNDRFSKPIAASKDAKSSSKEQEAGSLALESLHRQVLPFILRRMKEQVLDDLPPKIIQDYYCDLSEMQLMLYQDFAQSRAQAEIEDNMDIDSSTNGDNKEGVKASGAKHIFQALQYLRKLCNHPALVLSPEHPQYDKIQNMLRKDGTNIHDLQYAPKLSALKDLLLDCGIGNDGAETSDSHSQSRLTPGTISPLPVSQHRALIFCQQKQMLDMIEQDLFQREMPNVTFIRLDGNVDATKRHDIVRRFNSDPSIDVLLLTTHVGGLGLNLTGADTVIFVEHDWNPMKDLQAMDRAHRIGQKRVVNVYRLITRGSIEEKIMGLQRFKLSIASSVVNEKNIGLGTLIGAGGSEELLDLLNPPTSISWGGATQTRKRKVGSKEGVKEILQSLDAMWDEEQYREFTGTEFLAKLK